MPFGKLPHVGLRNHVLDGGQDWMNPFAAVRGDKMMLRLFAKLLCTLVITTIITTMSDTLNTAQTDSTNENYLQQSLPRQTQHRTEQL